MSESNGDKEFDLEQLAKRLAASGMPAQMVIAEEVGISQSTVSRAIQGKIKTPSKNAWKLWEYTSGRASLLGRGALENRTTGDEQRKLKSPKSRKRSVPPAKQRYDSAKLEEMVLKGVREYLDDAFDPLLVIEQLAVLRRAQDPRRRTAQQSAVGRQTQR